MLSRLLCCLLLAGTASVAWAQSAVVSDRTITPKEWTRLHDLVESLRGQETTKKLYRASPGLQEAFPAEPFFLGYISKWRPRLESLPKTRREAENVTLTLKELEDGEEWFMTIHHAKPKHAITLIKTGWRGGQVQSLAFTRGFTEVTGGRR